MTSSNTTIYIDTNLSNESIVAITQNQKLSWIEYESKSNNQHCRGDIFLGKICKIEKSLNAAFVDFGGNKQGFLPFKEIIPSLYMDTGNTQETKNINEKNKNEIADLIEKNLAIHSKVIVQIEKEERGGKGERSKGAALTTNYSLAGSFLVNMPQSLGSAGISKKASSNERDNIKDKLSQLNNPHNHSLIIRTAGIGKELPELQWDLDMLINLNNQIVEAAKTLSAPVMLHKEAHSIMRVIRDHLHQNVNEIIMNDESLFHELSHYIKTIRPEFVGNLTLYSGNNVPMFSHYGLEEQLDHIADKRFSLPSGGELVFGVTEAGTFIDVNSAKATQGHNIEETARKTNLEAADEITRQIQLKKIDGIIIIDFIDMSNLDHRQEVEQRVEKNIRHDRAKVRFEPISNLTGCMSLSRQRIGTPLYESIQENCPTCNNTGFVFTQEYFSRKIIDMIHKYACSDSCKVILLNCSVELATFLLNEKRQSIGKIESTFSVSIIIIPDTKMPQQKFTLKRFRGEVQTISTDYAKNNEEIQSTVPKWHSSTKTKPQAVITQTHAFGPTPKKQTTEGLFARLWRKISGNSNQDNEKNKRPQQSTKKPTHRNRRNNNHANNNQSRRTQQSNNSRRRQRQNPYRRHNNKAHTQQKQKED